MGASAALRDTRQLSRALLREVCASRACLRGGRHPPLPSPGGLGSGTELPPPSRLKGSVFLSSSFLMFLVFPFEGLVKKGGGRCPVSLPASLGTRGRATPAPGCLLHTSG